MPYYRTSIGKNHYYIKDKKSGILKFLQTSRTTKAIYNSFAKKYHNYLLDEI